MSLTEIHPFVWRSGEYFVSLYDPSTRPRRQDITSAERRFRGEWFHLRRTSGWLSRSDVACRVALWVSDVQKKAST